MITLIRAVLYIKAMGRYTHDGIQDSHKMCQSTQRTQNPWI